MALKAGYKGVKNNLLNKLKAMPFISTIGDGLTLEDGELSATGGGGGGADLSVIAPAFSAETAYTAGEYVTYENKLYVFTSDHAAGSWDASDVTEKVVSDVLEADAAAIAKTYKTDDATESAIVDADYIPFLDSSAASGAGAAKKSTWSNFCSKIASKLATTFNKYLGIESLGSGLTLDQDGVLTAAGTGSITITQIGSGNVSMSVGDTEAIISNMVLSTSALTFKFLEIIVKDKVTSYPSDIYFQEAAFFSYQNNTNLRYRFPLRLGRVDGFANIKEIDNTHFDVTINTAELTQSTVVDVIINGVL